MIIEFMSPKDGKPLIIIHIEKDGDGRIAVEDAAKNLKGMYPERYVLPILGSKPCPGNPLPKIGVFDKNNKPLLSAIKKMCEQGKPGGYVPLESDEMTALLRAQHAGYIVYF